MSFILMSLSGRVHVIYRQTTIVFIERDHGEGSLVGKVSNYHDGCGTSNLSQQASAKNVSYQGVLNFST